MYMKHTDQRHTHIFHIGAVIADLNPFQKSASICQIGVWLVVQRTVAEVPTPSMALTYMGISSRVVCLSNALEVNCYCRTWMGA